MPSLRHRGVIMVVCGHFSASITEFTASLGTLVCDREATHVYSIRGGKRILTLGLLRDLAPDDERCRDGSLDGIESPLRS